MRKSKVEAFADMERLYRGRVTMAGKQIVIDGTPYNRRLGYLDIGKQLGYDVSKTFCVDALTVLAERISP